MQSKYIAKVQKTMISNKNMILQNFIENNKNLAIQGSNEWKNARLKTIGGSEVAVLMGKNKYTTLSKLVMSKLGYNDFTGSIATYWGNCFEEIVRLHCNKKFKCNIQETGSIKYDKGYLSYSPDGITTINKNELLKIIPDLSEYDLDINHSEFLTLFEFKCPYMRNPSNEIPDHYLPQISIGKNIINFLEVGLFVQAIFRRCSINDIRYNSDCNQVGHFQRVTVRDHPLEYGYMTVTTKDKDMFDDAMNMFKFNNIKYNNDVYDIGGIYDIKIFEYILKNCVEKNFDLHYSLNSEFKKDVFSFDSYTKSMYNISLQRTFNNEINNSINTLKQDNYIIGIIPYKLMDVYITPVKKNPQYIENNKLLESAKKVIEFVNDHKELTKDELKIKLKKFKL